jgi:hypothetical protein
MSESIHSIAEYRARYLATECVTGDPDTHDFRPVLRGGWSVSAKCSRCGKTPFDVLAERPIFDPTPKAKAEI